jgi:hypothetical protein
MIDGGCYWQLCLLCDWLRSFVGVPLASPSEFQVALVLGPRTVVFTALGLGQFATNLHRQQLR